MIPHATEIAKTHKILTVNLGLHESAVDLGSIRHDLYRPHFERRLLDASLSRLSLSIERMLLDKPLKLAQNPVVTFDPDEFNFLIDNPLSSPKYDVVIVGPEKSQCFVPMADCFRRVGFRTWCLTIPDLVRYRMLLGRAKGLVFIGNDEKFPPSSSNARALAVGLRCQMGKELVSFFRREDTFSLGVGGFGGPFLAAFWDLIDKRCSRKKKRKLEAETEPVAKKRRVDGPMKEFTTPEKGSNLKTESTPVKKKKITCLKPGVVAKKLKTGEVDPKKKEFTGLKPGVVDPKTEESSVPVKAGAVNPKRKGSATALKVVEPKKKDSETPEVEPKNINPSGVAGVQPMKPPRGKKNVEPVKPVIVPKNVPKKIIVRPKKKAGLRFKGKKPIEFQTCPILIDANEIRWVQVSIDSSTANNMWTFGMAGSKFGCYTMCQAAIVRRNTERAMEYCFVDEIEKKKIRDLDEGDDEDYREEFDKEKEEDDDSLSASSEEEEEEKPPPLPPPAGGCAIASRNGRHMVMMFSPHLASRPYQWPQWPPTWDRRHSSPWMRLFVNAYRFCQFREGKRKRVKRKKVVNHQPIE